MQLAITVNPRGGLTIPRAMRYALALDPGGSLIAQLTPEGVLLRPAITFPLSESDARQMRAMLADEEGLDRFLRKRRRRTIG
jgi:antitoxin PrlF